MPKCRTPKHRIPPKMLAGIWAAANGGVTNGGLRGVWPPFLEIGRNRPFPQFFYLFRLFPEGAKSTWEIQKTVEKGPFPQISSDLLKPLSLLKFRRVTIRGAQPSARLSEEICLSEGSAGVSQRAPRGLSEGSAGSLRGSAGVRAIFRGFSGVVTLCS